MVLAGLFILIFAYKYILISPVNENIEHLSKKLTTLKNSVKQLETLKRKQLELSTLMVKARSRQSDDNTSLASRIESLLDKLKLADRASSIRPLPVTQSIGDGIEENIEITFDRLGFKDILDLLNDISSLPGSTRITELNIKKRGNVATMNLVVSSLLFDEGIDL